MLNIIHRTILHDRQLFNLKRFTLMKFICNSRLGFIVSLVGIAASFFIAESGEAIPPSPESFSVQTENFTLNFEVGDDGRLYQRAVGAADANAKLLRTDECYPQAGDGYVWEPALQVIHADGNTSTTLIFDGVTRTNDEAGRELTRIKLHDPAYPLAVTLNFRADRDRDVIEAMDGNRSSRIRPGDFGTHGFDRVVALADECLSDAFLRRLGEGNVVADHRTNHARHKSFGFKTRRARGSIPKSVLHPFARRAAGGKQRSRAGRFTRMVRQFSMRV